MVRKHAPVITRTLRTLSNIRVRNVATVGGALAHADPHMDLPPVLIALGARVVVQGKSGERTIPVADLFAGYFETVLAKDELISSLIVPAQDGRRAAYLKCTTRAVHDWPALGVAVSIAADGKAIKDASIVVSAATEKPGTAGRRREGARKARADEAGWRRAGEAAAEEAELITDGQGSAAYKKELVRVYVARALRAALGASVMATRTIGSGQVGRSVPRLEGAAKVTGRADYVHNIRLPKMLIGKIFRSTVAHGRIKSLDVSAAKALPGVYRVVTIDDIKTVIPNPFYGPAFHDQPILADGKVHYVGEPVAVVLATDPHIAEEAAVADRGRVRGAAGGVRRGRGDDLEGGRARRAQARGHVPRPQAPQGQEGHQHRARLPSAARRSEEGLRARPSMCSSTPSAASRCCTCRWSRLSRSRS